MGRLLNPDFYEPADPGSMEPPYVISPKDKQFAFYKPNMDAQGSTEWIPHEPAQQAQWITEMQQRHPDTRHIVK